MRPRYSRCTRPPAAPRPKSRSSSPTRWATWWSSRSWRRPATPYTRTSRIEVLLLDSRRCADIDLADPPRPSRGVSGLEQLPPSGGMARFEIVNTAESSAIVGSAHDGHGVRIALGCVDLMGSSLVAGGSVEVSLPLLRRHPQSGRALRRDVAVRFRPAAGGRGADRRPVARPRRLPAGSRPAAPRLHHRRAVARDGRRSAGLQAERGRGRRRRARRRARRAPGRADHGLHPARRRPAVAPSTAPWRRAWTRSRWACSAARRRRC